MPIPRHQARSSFTFEIKRASKRATEVMALSKTTSFARSSLADQVFSKVVERPRGPQYDEIERSAPVHLARVFTSARPEVNEPKLSAQPVQVPPRRILPDLFSIPIDPVAERVRQEAEERATHRRAPRVRRTKDWGAPQTSKSGDGGLLVPEAAQADLPDLTPESGLASRSPVQAQNSSGSGEPSRNRISIALSNRITRAERSGQPLPRLPAGQRWKRRLPKACW
jgi:hypothetical protein